VSTRSPTPDQEPADQPQPEPNPEQAVHHSGRRRAEPGRRPRQIRLIAAAAGAVAVIVGVLAIVLASGGSRHRAGPPSAAPAGPTTAAGTGTAGTGATVTPPQQPGLTPAESRLAASLNPFALHDCRPRPGGGTGNTDAALGCSVGVASAGPAPAEVLVVHYPTAAARSRDVAQRAAGIRDVGSCARGEPSVEDWGRSTRRLGAFLCYRAEGRFSIFWTIDASLVGFGASSDDPTALIAWWRGFQPIR
jgi:hypothetical protein